MLAILHFLFQEPQSKAPWNDLGANVGDIDEGRLARVMGVKASKRLAKPTDELDVDPLAQQKESDEALANEFLKRKRKAGNFD
jgi:hypothetical protein